MPPHHSHLENKFFEIKYIKLLHDSLPLILLCRNVTLRSNYLIILFQQAFFIEGVILIERVQD